MSYEDDSQPLRVLPEDSKEDIDRKQTLGAKLQTITADLGFQIDRVIKKEDSLSESHQSPEGLKHEEIPTDTKFDIKLEGIKEEPTDVKVEIDTLHDQESTDGAGCIHHMFNMDLVSVRQDDPQPVKAFKCTECNYQSNYESYLKRHMVVHKGKSIRRMFKCKECSFRCRKKKTLQGHKQIHMNRSMFKLFKCQECDFQCKRQDAFQRHMSFHEDQEMRMFRCQECSFKTKHKVNLQYHSLEHQRPSQAETFKCDQCGFKTYYKSRLKQHMVVHGTNLPHVTIFKWNACNVESKYKRSLEPHIHVDQSSVPAFECIECNYLTERRPQLSLHRFVHKDVSQGEMFSDESRFESENEWSPIKSELIKTEQ